jgi:hypothetical protein
MNLTLPIWIAVALLALTFCAVWLDKHPGDSHPSRFTTLLVRFGAGALGVLSVLPIAADPEILPLPVHATLVASITGTLFSVIVLSGAADALARSINTLLAARLYRSLCNHRQR